MRIWEQTGIGLTTLLACPAAAMATQGHGGLEEGLYVHQLSHIFFCISMGILIYWLRARNLTREPGWRCVGISAFLFILWSADAFTVHLLDEQLALIQTQNLGGWRLHIETTEGWEWLHSVYYLAKLDHLLCVPAIIFLYLGLHRLMIEAAEASGKPDADRETA
jgi:hypothetical protein